MTVRSRETCLNTNYYILNTKVTAYQKSIPYGAKGVQVEESKKEYTGDALALRGDERRDKLR